MRTPEVNTNGSGRFEPCLAAVIWIDWYAYHIARFRGLLSHPSLAGKVRGIELVGGVGVHRGLLFREELPAELPVETLMPATSWHDADQLALARLVWSSLSRIDPEVVLVPGYYTLPAVAAALWARINRRQSILMTESTADDHTRSRWKEAFKSALIYTLFDWAISGGKAHLRYLIQLGFPSERIRTSYDVVDNDFFEQRSFHLRRQTASSFGAPENYFLYVGRLSPEKNVDGLIAEWNLYREQGGALALLLVGDGPAADELHAVASSSPFAHDICFAGMKSYDELPQIYAFARCFVLPSTREPWGLVVNEAMASGLPVLVSTCCGCCEDLVETGVNGFIFDPAKRRDLASFLHWMEALSPLEVDQMGKSSRRIIRSFSPERLGSEVASIICN